MLRRASRKFGEYQWRAMALQNPNEKRVRGGGRLAIVLKIPGVDVTAVDLRVDQRSWRAAWLNPPDLS